MQGASPGLKRSARRLGFLAVFLAAALLIAATALAGHLPQNDQSEDRNVWTGNAFGFKSRGDPNKDCWRHHRVEGMEDSHIIIPIVPQAIEVGKSYPVKIQVVNAWKYYLSTLRVQMNVKENQTYVVPLVAGVSPPQPDDYLWDGILATDSARLLPPYRAYNSSAELNFTVGKDAVSIRGHLELDFASGGVNGTNTFIAQWKRAGGGAFIDFEPSTNNTKATRDFSIPTVHSGTPVEPVDGVWKILLNQSGPSPTANYFLRVTVEYKQGGASNYTVFQRQRDPPGNAPDPAMIVDVGMSQFIEFEIVGVSPGTQTIEFVASADLYYDHASTAIPDEDQFNRYRTLTIRVGDAYEPPLFSEVIVTGGLKVPFYLAAAEITGFVGAFLLLPSLLLGGTYGRGSRKFFNAMLGGAKRRVMFHNLLSMGLTIVAILHVVFFLLEIRYTVLMGVLWGGLGTLALLGLGLTGFYQVPLIQRHGYGWWRYLHLWLGLFVCVFVAYHALADGAHFAFLKEQLPLWLQKLNFVQA